MKKFVILSLCLVAILSFAFQKSDAVNTPSVKTEKAFDTLDLDAQMKVYEGQMKELEKKMKPFELQMKEKEKEMRPLEKLMREKEKEMREGGDTRKIGEEMRKIGDNMSKVGNEMSKIGDQMGVIGNEMHVVGDKMGEIGHEMEKRHKRIFSWFFNEMVKDGLMKVGDKMSIHMETNLLVVNGKTLDAAQLDKYKKGIEARLGKPLDEDFSVFFKGVLTELTSDSFEHSGNMSTNF